MSTYSMYMETWCEAQKMARKHEEQEFNTKTMNDGIRAKKMEELSGHLLTGKGKV